MSAPIAVGLIALSIGSGLTVLSATTYVTRTAQAAAVADSAALAAADSSYLGLETAPCAVAAKVAAANAAELEQCEIAENAEVIESTESFRVTVRVAMPGVPRAVAAAHAGW